MAAPFVERKLADPSLPNRWRTTFFSGGVMEFWTAPQIASIHKMLNPSSIAIVGATPRMQYGGRLAEVVLLMGRGRANRLTAAEVDDPTLSEAPPSGAATTVESATSR